MVKGKNSQASAQKDATGALESLGIRREHAGMVLRLLKKRYPDPNTLLNAVSPWELLVATILAAQCTDERVNKVTPWLFARWPDSAAMADANLEEVEECVRPTGFFHNKAKNLISTAQRIQNDFGGNVPRTMADMLHLAGVARKTANVVLYGAYGIVEGLAVDTHVARISRRLGLTSTREPIPAEKELMALFPREDWGYVNHAMVWFGRDVCQARKPQCADCEMSEFCPKVGVERKGPAAGGGERKEHR